jgi:4'-phosphopantetheinyl transferase EntD
VSAAVELDVLRRAVPGARTAWEPVQWPYAAVQQTVAGRRAAATALVEAGAERRVVPRGSDGRPCFPRGFAGSIAHTSRLAVAIVVPGAAGVGIDIESEDVSARVARFILREPERRALLRPAGRYSARDLFAAKEAAFKALSGAAVCDGLPFWRIALTPAGGALLASCGEVSARVRVRSGDASLAVAIRRPDEPRRAVGGSRLDQVSEREEET